MGTSTGPVATDGRSVEIGGTSTLWAGQNEQGSEASEAAISGIVSNLLSAAGQMPGNFTSIVSLVTHLDSLSNGGGQVAC